VKFIAPLPSSRRKKHYQFTAIDDCTRIRVLRIYERLNQQSAIRFLDYVLETLPFKVEVIQTDHGAEFGSQFHYHVLDRGIGHVYIKPATPRLNGKVERSRRIDAEEFYWMLDGVVIDDIAAVKGQPLAHEFEQGRLRAPARQIDLNVERCADRIQTVHT